MHCSDAREVAASSRVSNGADPTHRVRSAAAFAGQLKILRPLQPYLHPVAYIWNSGSLTIILPMASLTCN